MTVFKTLWTLQNTFQESVRHFMTIFKTFWTSKRSCGHFRRTFIKTIRPQKKSGSNFMNDIYETFQNTFREGVRPFMTIFKTFWTLSFTIFISCEKNRNLAEKIITKLSKVHQLVKSGDYFRVGAITGSESTGAPAVWAPGLEKTALQEFCA